MSGKILVIAEQQRLQRLFDDMTEATVRGVTVVAGLTDAADQLELALPGLILVQDRMSGLSGELIIRYLRNRLGEAATTIVLVTDGAESLVVDDQQLQLLDSSLPDQELMRQLERLVVRLPRPLPALPAVPEPEPVAAEDEFVPLHVPAIESPVAVAPVPVPEVIVSAAAAAKAYVQAEIGETLHEMVAAASPDRAPVVASRFEAELETELARHEPVETGTLSPAGGEPVLSLREMLTVANSAPSGRSRSTVVILGGLGILLVIGLVVLQLPTTGPTLPQDAPVKSNNPGNKSVPDVAVPAIPPAVQAPPASVLPAGAEPQKAMLPVAAPPVPVPKFVSGLKADLDPAYGRANAGWERYLTPALEFKLFREQGKLQALQVVDRAGAGISPRLFSTAIAELAGVKDYQTETREIKGDYLVKKGRLATGSRIIIYKDRQDDQLHGFVIYFK